MPSALKADPLEILDRAVRALGGDERAGQQRLTEAVSEAIDSGRHLVAEAPTGSGKSLAYLAAVLASGARAVVATATLALQDQLWRKDLPHLEQHAGVEFSRALVKGRSNYLCVAKLAAGTGSDELALFEERPSGRFKQDLVRLQRFAKESDTGDVTDRPESIEPASWRLVTCGPNECPGALRCDHGESCFSELARVKAEDANVIVVNHSLYCAHLATEGRILPEHDVVIFDEAHALDRTATGALGCDLTGGGLRQVATRLRRVGAPEQTVDALGQASERLDELLETLQGRVDPSLDEQLSLLLLGIGEQLTSAARGVKDEGTAAAQAVKLASSRLEAVRRIQTPGDRDVVWVEGSAERRSLRLAPVTIGPRLAPVLFAKVPSILMSATLGPGMRFQPFARSLGLDPDADPDDSDETPGLAYRSVRIESPFDYRDQAMLYVPRHLPDVREPGWEQLAGDEIASLVGAAGGRALVLCTSWRAVHAYSALLRERTDHVVHVQGDDPPGQLIERFTGDETSCLVATRAFWMGLDVPGPSCVLVVIDRLPFARPDEPLEQARREVAEQEGGNGFMDVDLPAAALVLAQGAGRLIRGHADRGVVAVLDRRLATARYRTVLLEALPPMRRVVESDVVTAFLASVTSG